MNCRKAKKLIPSYLAPNEPWFTSTDRAGLISHIARCDSCRQEYEETRKIVHLFQQYGQISEDTQALLDKAKLEEPGQKSVKVLRLSRISVIKVASVAAAILICLSIVLAFWGNQGDQNRAIVQQRNAQNNLDALEISVTENGVTVSVSDLRTTESTQIREFLINNRHRLVMNRDTILSIKPLVRNEKLGCLIDLRSGQILSHVNHDGNPFEVHTPNCTAVITGTTFDIQVQDQTTSLIVSEGSVRFESEKGAQQVAAGQRSMVVAGGKPSIPESCQTSQLMAWATGKNVPPALVETIGGQKLPKLSDELLMSGFFPGQPIALESIDYDQWIEEKRAWFRGQFPWIFELQKTLNTDNRLPATSVDYPELLLDSGYLWQIVYPHRFYKQIPVIQRDSLLKLVDGYQLDRTGLAQIISRSRSTDRLTSQMSFGQDALNQWITQARVLETTCGEPDKLIELCEYSMAIAEYLENTRALAYLCLQNGTLSVASDRKQACLNLLQQQVVLLHAVRQMGQLLHQAKGPPSEAQILKLVSLIEVIMELEGCIVDYGFQGTDDRAM